MSEEDLTPTSAGGFCSRYAGGRYVAITGRDLDHINYYRAFLIGAWLPSIRASTNAIWSVMGEGHDVDLEAQKQGVTTLSEAALELLE